MWIAVGGTPESVIRAGLLGLPLALAIIGGEPARFAPLVQLYHRALDDGGHPRRPVAVHAHGYIAKTERQAVDDFYPPYAVAMTKLGRERGWGPMNRDQFDALRAPHGSLMLGTPEQVAAKIDAMRDVLGIERFMLHISVGTIEHHKVLDAIDLLGRRSPACSVGATRNPAPARSGSASGLVGRQFTRIDVLIQPHCARGCSGRIVTSPVAAGPVDDNTALGVAVRLEALADPARVKLMSLLLAPETGEATTGGLADLVGLSESPSATTRSAMDYSAGPGTGGSPSEDSVGADCTHRAVGLKHVEGHTHPRRPRRCPRRAGPGRPGAGGLADQVHAAGTGTPRQARADCPRQRGGHSPDPRSG